jgi:Ca-activated chloride channel family protein
MQIKDSPLEELSLKSLNVNACLKDSIGVIKMTQVYLNDKDAPIELEFHFPKEEKSLVSRMVVTIADKTIEAKILEKEKAKEKYDDAIAAGNSAALMNEASPETLSLQIGNILPQ